MYGLLSDVPEECDEVHLYSYKIYSQIYEQTNKQTHVGYSVTPPYGHLINIIVTSLLQRPFFVPFSYKETLLMGPPH